MVLSKLHTSRPFFWKNGILHAESVPVPKIAATVGTPVYIYSQTAIETAFQAYQTTFAGLDVTICYAVKANSNQAVIACLAAQGAGADVVSEGELRRALAAGVPKERIVFAGVGKSQQELNAGLEANILQFNVESEAELEALAALAHTKGQTAAIALRVNPDIEAGTHAKITTGTAANKFGIDIDYAPHLFRRAAAHPGLRLEGISVHIGSQLTDLTPFAAAFRRVVRLVAQLHAEGIFLKRIDLGGGLGIAYQEESPSLAAYADLVREIVAPMGLPLILEPGRSLVGSAGILLTRCLYEKYNRPDPAANRRFVIVDAAMNDLIRPTLYDAHHGILCVNQPISESVLTLADLVGPICETGDRFAQDRLLPPIEAGDLIVLDNAGAYGAVMAGNYNSRPLLAEVMVCGDKFAVIRPRQNLNALIAQDKIPSWL